MRIIGFCIIVTALGLSCKQNVTPVITKIDKTFLKKEISVKEVQLVDVRTPEEYNAGHIDGAVNYNITDGKTFSHQIENLDKGQPVYLYCKMGGRSNRAAQLLMELGFIKIFDYSGGYNDWAND